MPNLFDSVKMTKPGKNVFDLSHDVKMSLRMGDLVPTLLLECVPGDSIIIGCSSLLRFAPLVAPPMHRMDVTMHYFFVPNRLLWPNWENFITNGGATPTPGATPAFPTIDADQTTWVQGGLMDYLGIPNPSIGVPFAAETISALPFAAYQLIYNEYYRDQNLQANDWVAGDLIDGNNGNPVLLQLRKRCWEHDYFTSALPFAQKGATVDIPLGDVQLKAGWPGGHVPEWHRPAGNQAADGDLTTFAGNTYSSAEPATPLAFDPHGSLEVDSTTINDLRRAFRLQEWLEKAARGGSRYIESILAHFGVRSSDKRLNRPEYITGTKSPVVISEVLQTGETGTTPQGNQAGHAVAVTNGKYGHYYCEEHGYIIGIMNVQPKTAYFQGINRTWLKFDPFDYYWPSFANIGEQEIFNKEIYAFQGTAGDDTFGYIPRYSEYKFQPSRVAGDMRTTLDFWHMAREFSSPPALNDAFVKADPTERIFAVTDPTIDKLYTQVLHKIRAVRPMPKYGNPSF